MPGSPLPRSRCGSRHTTAAPGLPLAAPARHNGRSLTWGVPMPRLILAPLALIAALAALLALTPAVLAQKDVAGGKDYPGIGRFMGSLITGYQAKDFDATRLQAAAFKAGKAVDERRPEGKVTRIAYRTGAGPSILEVARNFETQLMKAGYDTLLSCSVDQCGGIPFSEGLDGLPLPQMWVDGFDYRYFAGHK